MLAFLSLLAEHSRVNSFILLIMERYRNYYSTGLASALPINLLKKKKKKGEFMAAQKPHQVPRWRLRIK